MEEGTEIGRSHGGLNIICYCYFCFAYFFFYLILIFDLLCGLFHYRCFGGLGKPHLGIERKNCYGNTENLKHIICIGNFEIGKLPTGPFMFTCFMCCAVG